MPWGLIINSLVCVAGAIAGTMFAGASIISIANMQVPWRGALLVGAFLVPLTFVISGIGAWFTPSHTITLGLYALPWAYGLLFVASMLLSFKQS